jgi:hypothetical protein
MGSECGPECDILSDPQGQRLVKSLTQTLPPRESSDSELDCGDKGRKGLGEVFIILGKPAARPSQANVCSTIQRLGRTSKPVA